jgi:nitroimidazol reductase NimA-like FMN-containing flavoprotein (pyridoxamine 5'-phosphate oxidase superfamily)
MPDDLIRGSGSASLHHRPGEPWPRVIENLDKDECLRLLAARRVGRLGYTSREGPAVAPVVYKMHDSSLIFHPLEGTNAEEDLRTGIAEAEYEVAFEIDQVDPLAGWGWTVLVVGPAHFVDTEAERASIIAAGDDPFPWLEEESAPLMRVHPHHFYGRRSYVRVTVDES